MSYHHYYQDSGLFHGSSAAWMHTQLDVLLVGAAPDSLQQLWQSVEAELFRIQSLLNRFDSESPVALLNREAAHYPVQTNDELWQILLACQRYYAWTQHYFDVTLQAFDQVLLNEADQSVFFFSDTLQLDFGGYAKGYALQRLETLIRNAGVTQALVNFGNSSVLAIGKHPYGDYWPIGIDNPYTGKRIADVALMDQTLSVSGNMPSHTRHILNPKTGRYSDEAQLVSVISNHSVEAEVLSTTLMVAATADIAPIESAFGEHEKQLYRL